MDKFRKTTLFITSTILATTLCTAIPTSSHAAKRSSATTGTKLLDAVVVRPTALVWAFAASGLYLGTTPLTIPTGISEKTARYLYRKPWKYVSGRPLGVWR